MIRAWTRLTLLQRFTVVSALITIGLAVVLSYVTAQAVHGFVVNDEAQVAAELVLRTFSPQLRPSDLQGSLPPERRALLDALFRAHGISDKILRIKLWRADGRLLYSNTGESGAPPRGNIDISTPAGFRAFVAIRRQMETDAPGVSRVFVPVQVEGKPGTLGAFEIFYDLTLLNQRLDGVERAIWMVVPTGLFLLYASVFVLVRRASRQLLKQQADLITAHVGTYHALASAIDAKDSYTGDHSTRVADIAVALGRAMGVGHEAIEELRIGARLHDLGKIGIPDTILMKPARLNREEQIVMRRHAAAGFEILREAPFSDEVKRTVRHVHERWDGGGYPEGLAGEAIPLGARIVAIVDAYEAMRGDRPYRKGISREEALERIRADSGTHFDAAIVESFTRLMEQPRKGPAAAKQVIDTRAAGPIPDQPPARLTSA